MEADFEQQRNEDTKAPGRSGRTIQTANHANHANEFEPKRFRVFGVFRGKGFRQAVAAQLSGSSRQQSKNPLIH
jgi:hypothetical protein